MNCYRIYWLDNSRTVIIVEFLQSWTWEDASSIQDQIDEMIYEAGNRVSVVYHYTSYTASILPSGTRQFTNLLTFMRRSSYKRDKIVLVNANRLMCGFLEIISRAYDLGHVFQRYHFVKSYDDALKLVQKDQVVQDIS